ncbi:MAG: hypothetical protein RRA92_06400 [Gemmatimonadota bacterium]|nr:hypothetical protein [Gemmatimonadota bacterium]
MKTGTKGLAFAATAAFALGLSACEDGPVTPGSGSASGSAGAGAFNSELVCETVDFEGFGVTLDEGVQVASDPVNAVTVFGLPITVSTTSFDAGGTAGAGTNQAVVIDANAEHAEDYDLTTSTVGGICDGCGPLGKMLVVLDPDGFAAQGDSRYGGTISFTGFGASADDLFLRSVTFVDFDQAQDPNEPESRIDVDGTTVAVPPETGDGGVATGFLADKEIILDKIEMIFAFRTSGAIDELEICKDEPGDNGGGQGCTPGYWKQSQHFDNWTGHAPADLLSSVFDVAGISELQRPEDDLDVNSITLLQGLQLRGGGVNALIRHAVAALLNAANTDVDYDLSEADVIAEFAAAVAGTDDDIEEQKDRFAGFNEQGCPLN